MSATVSRPWVDEGLLGGAPDEVCLRIGRDIDRAELATLVDEWERRLLGAGLTAGGTLALRLPPSLAYVGVLLAGWRVGAQVSLLDHRLTQAEVDRALERVGAQYLVQPTESRGHRLCGYAEVTADVTPRPQGRPADTDHVLIQFSSGSTGASKVIARTAADLAAELDRYDRLPEYPRRGERIVLLASIVHVLGLVGGLLYALHAGARLVFPERLTAEGILDAVRADDAPATVLGVPFYAELLVAAGEHRIPQLTRMVVAGELVRPGVPEKFRAAFGVPLGTMYGMTEYGVIATDLLGALWPSVRPTHATQVRAVAGELQIAMAATPYIGLADPTRFADGWLRTRDAAVHDEATGLVTILGRLDSQISIGGLKVDLTEVEQTLGALPGVTEAVVVHDNGSVEAYVSLGGPTTAADVTAGLARELAPFKRPRRLHVLDRLPRTATGKIVRDPTVLKAATGGD